MTYLFPTNAKAVITQKHREVGCLIYLTNANILKINKKIKFHTLYNEEILRILILLNQLFVLIHEIISKTTYALGLCRVCPQQTSHLIF